MEFPKLKSIEVVSKFILHIKYEDGVNGDADLSEFKNKGIFKTWNNPSEFEKVQIDKERNVLKWSDSIDLDADALYLQIQGLTFSQWKENQLHATTN
ncbi:MAG TPA: DUF2442 domain-containing protein [Chitinophagaceae bacterium]|nr:DUF2442 domain-containing protein [Chitinophagaceae bacterium]